MRFVSIYKLKHSLRHWPALLTLSFFPTLAHGFDLEDYATTYRATRDAYMKASNEVKLALGPVQIQMAMYQQLEKACLRVNMGSEMLTLQTIGTLDGSCRADGEIPHTGGGSLPKGGVPKFGDQLGNLILSVPYTSDFPNGYNFEDAATTFRARRDAKHKEFSESNLGTSVNPWFLTTIPNCKVTDEALLKSIQKNPSFLDDWKTTWRATRDAYLMALNEMTLASAPYKAARDAYVAASTVFTTELGCQSQMGRTSASLNQSAYDWPEE